MNNRKIYLEALLREAVRIMKEQAPPLPAGSAVPPSPLPPAPATNASAVASQPPAQAPTDPNAPQAPDQPKPFDVDEMIERINLLRSGKTFKDPEVYGQVTSYFKGLSETDKAVIDRFLQSVGQIVTQGDQSQQQSTNGGTPQPPMQQAPAPVAPAPAPGAPAVGGM